MRKIFCSLVVCLCAVYFMPVANAGTFSCGDGYVLVDNGKKIDGIPVKECEKLWCYDLETGKPMGRGNTATNGYRATSVPVQMEDIKCFGERKWCNGERAGVWNSDLGIYTRNGSDSLTYTSYKKGGCFAWRLEKPNCPDGQTAFLINNESEWACGTAVNTQEAGRASAIRRTGAVRRR